MLPKGKDGVMVIWGHKYFCFLLVWVSLGDAVNGGNSMNWIESMKKKFEMILILTYGWKTGKWMFRWWVVGMTRGKVNTSSRLFYIINSVISQRMMTKMGSSSKMIKVKRNINLPLSFCINSFKMLNAVSVMLLWPKSQSNELNVC